MKKFKFLENIATADSAFEAYGKTLNKLFENAALALFETMANTKIVKPLRESHFSLHASNLDDLLFDFLSELVFVKDKRGMIFSKFKVEIKKLKAKSYKLKANIWGEKIDQERHNLKIDVKAVTRHRFGIKKEKDKYVTRVVLDI